MPTQYFVTIVPLDPNMHITICGMYFEMPLAGTPTVGALPAKLIVVRLVWLVNLHRRTGISAIS
jgi:hypothetical protein